MPRPRKCRRVCTIPSCTEFGPMGKGNEQNIIMSVDEYEVIRLIDFEGMNQEDCAAQMEVARTTIQAIYASARKKLAQCIVEGAYLTIAGGDVRFCGRKQERKECMRRSTNQAVACNHLEGEHNMRVAVTYEAGEIFQHFGHTENFKLYDIEDGAVTKQVVVNTNGNGHGALADFLKDNGVDTLICGGIGAGAQSALQTAGIKLFGGVAGDADQAVEAFLKDKLVFNPDVKCDHHGDHHHDEGHNCGGTCSH